MSYDPGNPQYDANYGTPPYNAAPIGYPAAGYPPPQQQQAPLGYPGYNPPPMQNQMPMYTAPVYPPPQQQQQPPPLAVFPPPQDQQQQQPPPLQAAQPLYASVNSGQQPVYGLHTSGRVDAPTALPPPPPQVQPNTPKEQWKRPEFDFNGEPLPKVQRVLTSDYSAVAKLAAQQFLGGTADEASVQDRINAAAKEHNPPQLDLFADSIEANEARLGSGIRYYFTFIKFLTVLTVVFAVFQCATYGQYVQSRGSAEHAKVAPGVTNFIDDLTITVYAKSKDLPLWQAMNIVCVILAFLAAPIYFFVLKLLTKNDEVLALSQFSVLDELIRFTSDGRIDVSTTYRSRSEKIVRRLIVLGFIALMIGLQVLSSLLITRVDSSNIGIAFAIAFVASALNILFSYTSYYLTEFEKWDTFAAWNAFHTMKLLAFKLANIITVFAAKRYSQTSNTKCTYSTIGEQFISLLFVEIFFVNLQKILSGMFFSSKAQSLARMQGSIFGDQDNMPQFDLPLEYLNVVYRHYLTLMAMITIPYSILLSLFGYFVQFWVEKYYLYKLCGMPRKTDSSMKTFLTTLLVFVAACALLTPYAGTMFVLSGITRDLSPLCYFP